jgi:Ca2+-binding RTX toxin-like protein
MARTTRLGLEPLEARDTPAVTAVIWGGDLRVTGTGVADNVSVQAVGSSWEPSAPPTHVRVNVHHADGTTAYHWFDWSAVGIVQFYGLGGNDRFVNETNKKSTAEGGPGNDFLRGGGSTDVLVGGIGNDQLYGGEGDDYLYGQAGDDYLSDRISVGDLGYRQGGSNYLDGGDGTDTLIGGSGADWLDGGLEGDDGEADVLWGLGGADTFVRETVSIGPLFGNRDAPKDFSAADGDVMYSY